MMTSVLRRARVLGGCFWLATLLGCATTERDAVRQVDFTSEIVHQAQSLFAADRELARFPITVDGFHGAMRLKGDVLTPEQKERAGRLVWALRGVTSVENELHVGHSK